MVWTAEVLLPRRKAGKYPELFGVLLGPQKLERGTCWKKIKNDVFCSAKEYTKGWAKRADRHKLNFSDFRESEQITAQTSPILLVEPIVEMGELAILSSSSFFFSTTTFL